MDTRVFRGYNVGSDHYLVVTKIILCAKRKPIKTSIEQENEEVFKVYLLKQGSIWRFYQDRRKIQPNIAPTSNDIEEEWCNIKQMVSQAAKEAIGARKLFRRRRGLKISKEEVEANIAQKQNPRIKYLNSQTPEYAEQKWKRSSTFCSKWSRCMDCLLYTSRCV